MTSLDSQFQCLTQFSLNEISRFPLLVLCAFGEQRESILLIITLYVLEESLRNSFTVSFPE